MEQQVSIETIMRARAMLDNDEIEKDWPSYIIDQYGE